MAKITLNDISNFQSSAIATINNNNAAIEAAIEQSLFRNGESPNTMNGSLDMNSQRIINLPPPISDQEPVRFGDIDYGADNLKIATQPEAEAGEQNNVLMTPLRTSQFFDAQHDNIISDIKETSTSLDNADHVPTPLPGTAIDNGTYDAFGITCVLPSGKVLIFYRQGTEHVGDIGTIKKRESLDGGKTWSTASTVASNSDLDLRNIGGGVTPSGRIVLAYMKYDPNGVSSSNALITSDDEGATWSAEREITAGVPNSPYGPLVAIGSGKVALSLYGGYTGRLVISGDNFDTWGNAISLDAGSPARSETSLVYLGGSYVLALAREAADSGNVAFRQFLSSDNGLTWTSVGSTTFDDWSYSQATPPWLQRFKGPDGRLRVVCYYLHRGVGKLYSIYADAEDLISNGVSAWDSTNKIEIASGFALGGSGYPSVIHCQDSPFGIGWYYDEYVSNQYTKITTLVSPRTLPLSVGGAFGVGTTKPKAGLHVRADAQLATPPSIGTGDSKVNMFLSQPDANYGLLVGSLNSGNGFLQAQRVDDNPIVYDLLLQPNGGNIGVGKSPSVALDINGAITASGELKGGRTTITSNSSAALAVGRQGSTSAGLQVDASAANSVTGIKITPAATTGGVDLAAQGDTNTNLRINASGTGTISLGSVSTGFVRVPNVNGLWVSGGSYDGNFVIGGITSWKSGLRKYNNANADVCLWNEHPAGVVWVNSGHAGDGAAAAPTTGFKVAATSALAVGIPLGYGTGSGGAVTQASNKSTGVTLDKICGEITMHNATLNASTSVTFTVTNNTVTANDTVQLSIKSGGTAGAYIANIAAVSTGSFVVHLRNVSAGNLGEAVVLNYTVLKSVNS